MAPTERLLQEFGRRKTVQTKNDSFASCQVSFFLSWIAFSRKSYQSLNGPIGAPPHGQSVMPLAGKGPSSAKESAKRLKEKELALWLRLRAERKNSARLDPAKVRQTDIPFKNNFFPRMLLKGLHKSKRSSFESPVQLAGRLL